ncbi:MAG: AsmA family protein [Micropepsaceae bacterium]
MWRVLRWVILGVVLVVGVLVALPFLVPTSVYKEQIIAQTQLATGRALTIDGDLKLSFWPAFGVEVGKVSFANATGAATPQMVTMDSMVVGAELMPLLSGTLNVTQVRFVNPTINLEIDKQGRGNWWFEPAPGAVPAGAEAKPAGGGSFSFRDVEIKGGTLTYADARTETAQRIDGIDVSVKLSSLDEPMTVKGGLTWNKEAITVDAAVANPRALSAGGKSELKSKVDGEVLNATFDGTIDAGKSEVAGDVDFRTQSARRLAAWAGVALPEVRGFGPMTLSGALRSTASEIAFNKAKLSLDGMNGSGNLALDTSGARPRAKGDFELDRLDLNPYMGSGAAPQGGAAGGAPEWSDAPLDFAALGLVDADLDFAVNALSVGGMKIGRSALGIALNDGKLRANLKQMALYGGNGSGVISLASAAAPQVGLDLSFAGVQGEPFLTDAAGFTRLSGTGNIALKVAAVGSSQRALMKALDGTMQITFTDGAIKGVNLAEIARTIQSALSGTAVGAGAKTDFAELSGSFVIRDGVAANKDLKLLNPFVRLTGAGIVDVGNQTLDYRVEPKAVRSAEGQGAQGSLGGIGIPFRIKGPWSKLSYAPDLSGVLNSTVDSILKGGDPLESLKDSSGLGDLFGKKKPKPGEQPQPSDPKKKDPLDPLKGLFGQ